MVFPCQIKQRHADFKGGIPDFPARNITDRRLTAPDISRNVHLFQSALKQPVCDDLDIHAQNIVFSIFKVNSYHYCFFGKNINMSIGTRIKEARSEKGLSQKALADAVGMRQPTLSALESGKTQGTSLIATFAAKLGVNALWLETGKGPKYPDTSNIEPAPDIQGQVPVISWVTAGKWTEVIDIYQPSVADEWLPCIKKHSNRTFALRVKGMSMYNPMGKHTYSDGDIIFVDPEKEAINGSRIVVRLENSKEATFKQLVIEGEKMYLMALNPSWPDRIIEVKGNATICGVVIGKWTDE